MADDPIEPQDLNAQKGGRIPPAGEVITPQEAASPDVAPETAPPTELTPDQIRQGTNANDRYGGPAMSSGESQGPVPDQQAVGGGAINHTHGVPTGIETRSSDKTTSDPA